MKARTAVFPPIDFRTRFPALDGLRGLALVVVFTAHFGFFFAHGNLWQFFFLHAPISVDLWFVLSGFLITGILHDTRTDGHFFKRFYLRRAIRIFPIFYLVAAILLLLTPVLHFYWRAKQLYFLVYLGNYFANSAPSLYFAISRSSHLMTVHFGPVWSLCVEEQFYLIWPLIVWMIPDRIRLIQVSVGLGLAGFAVRTFFVLRFFGPTESQTIFCTLPFRMEDLLAGAVLALLLRGPAADSWQRSCRWILPVAVAVLGVIFVAPRPARQYLTDTIGYTVIAIASAALIGWVLPAQGRLARGLSAPALRLLGKYSYSFYIFHNLPLFAWMGLNGWLARRYSYPKVSGVLLVVFIFFFNLLLAKLSFDLFEVRFLRFKRYLRYDRETQPDRGLRPDDHFGVAPDPGLRASEAG